MESGTWGGSGRGEVPGHGAIRYRGRLTSGVVLSWRWLACPGYRGKVH
jgi:hypothetical protein